MLLQGMHLWREHPFTFDIWHMRASLNTWGSKWVSNMWVSEWVRTLLRLSPMINKKMKYFDVCFLLQSSPKILRWSDDPQQAPKQPHSHLFPGFTKNFFDFLWAGSPVLFALSPPISRHLLSSHIAKLYPACCHSSRVKLYNQMSIINYTLNK